MIEYIKKPLQVLNDIPRFIEIGSDYTSNFGFQWNKFTKTQVDGQHGNSENNISKERLLGTTNWDKEDLEGKNILEAGSGAGRFSEIILQYTKANLYSFDYSNAVEANWKNNHRFGNRFNLFQASIYEIPFEKQQFDKVICIGVLQHTPNFKDSVLALCDMVKPGGELVLDFYPINGWWTKIHAKYILRPFTKKMNHENLLKKIENNIDWMISTTHFLHKIKLGFLCRFLPIVDIYGTLPLTKLSREELRENCILDTFDMYGPAYDNPQRITTVAKWVKLGGLKLTHSKKNDFSSSSAAIVKGIREKK